MALIFENFYAEGGVAKRLAADQFDGMIILLNPLHQRDAVILSEIADVVFIPFDEKNVIGRMLLERGNDFFIAKNCRDVGIVEQTWRGIDAAA